MTRARHARDTASVDTEFQDIDTDTDDEAAPLEDIDDQSTTEDPTSGSLAVQVEEPRPETSSARHARLLRRLELYGFMLPPVDPVRRAGDGNCFPASIAANVFPNRFYHDDETCALTVQHVRRAIVKYLANNPDMPTVSREAHMQTRCEAADN